MYQALYRKYRPAVFDDVISQPHITTTLKNQVISGKTAHAYLFTGSRGTGKTTCARIFAKALCCENTKDGNPCGVCDICRDADNFALSDIIEIDAASNGSVSDARELREAAEYTPERCRYKIYIIDEVHMLSKDAFNALLKVIEEPPAHIKFIMATTELHKVLPTILSRCQRFEFRRIKPEDITGRLSEIAAKEGFSLDEDGARLIARAADGGMRDALSILDRCAALSENITAEVVSEAAGMAGRDSLFALAEAVADKDPAKALDTVSALYARSKDMQRLCEELSEQMRNVMIAISAPDRTDIIVCLPSEMDIIKRIASKMTLERVLSCLDVLSSCAERMSRSLSKRTDMEMCVIRLCSDISPQISGGGAAASQAQPEINGGEIARLGARVAELEDRLRSGGMSQPVSRQRSAPQRREAPREIPPEAENNEFVYIPQWDGIIAEMEKSCPAVAPMLKNTFGYEHRGRLVINTRESFLKKLMGTEDNKTKMLEAVQKLTGKSFSTVLTGYRANLDRSVPTGGGESGGGAPAAAPTPAENLDALLKKAESGGVPVTDENS